MQVTHAELQSDYLEKPESYYRESRHEMVAFVPTFCRRVLDVGCSSGEFGALLKRQRDIEVWGVEPFRAAASLAAAKLDRVLNRAFEPNLMLPSASFDCIVFNDVLEHLVDPSPALRYSKSLLAPGGVVVASVPNIRHFPTMWRLIVHGEWTYREWGTLDKTHLRFYTKSSLHSLFEDEGYAVKSCTGINSYVGVPNVSKRVWRLFEVINVMTRQKFVEMKFQQFAIVAGLPDPLGPTSDVV